MLGASRPDRLPPRRVGLAHRSRGFRRTDLTFEYEPEELGIDTRTAARIEEIKQLRPLAAGQPSRLLVVKYHPSLLCCFGSNRGDDKGLTSAESGIS